ncbi:TPA: hypothetical protein M4Z47_006164 [Klebsiella variicola]|nr:hypothetical protein [Klebsiella variicola]HDK6070170.1 hypothetical protein [Klebsiella variicola]
MVNTNFNTLLAQAPHKDITAINKFITSSCFTRTGQETLSFIRKMGYRYNLCDTSIYIRLVKEQFEEARRKFGDSVEIDFFCDVAGTKYFEDFMAVYDKDSFYQEMIYFNPDFNYTGNLKSIRNRAFTAVREKDLQNPGEGVSYLIGALENALKRIGVNPEDEMNGMTKALIMAMTVMNDIGGMQFYLPKGELLKRVVNKIDIYTDSYTMGTQQLAIKYGVSFKAITLVIKSVRQAIKEYEGK